MSQQTHYPHRTGPVCGLMPAPTDARNYTVDDPTCPKCKDWIDKVRASSPGATSPPAPPSKSKDK